MEAKPYLQSIALQHDSIDSYDEYPFDIPAVRELDYLDFHPDVTFLVGENGSGKSTLIEAIALLLGFGPEGGTKNVQFRTSEDISPLSNYLTSSRSFKKPKDHFFLRAESFYNVATYMDDVGYLRGYGDKSLHARSHGEAFMAALTMKLSGRGLYILDEPEAALSPTRQMAAVSAIHQLVQDDSQFIIATHSPILLSYPNSRILLLDGTGISEVEYEDTEHFAITRHFLNNYERQLALLMDDPET